MKSLSACLATLILMSVPNAAFGQSVGVGSLPEGRLLLSHCRGELAHGGDMCNQVPDSVVGFSTQGPPELFTLDPAGEQQVTDNDLYEFGGTAWSPSGKKVAVSGSPRDLDVEECRVYVVTVATGEATPITPYAELACAYAQDWSPDGNWILMTVYFHDGPTQLYKVRPDGTGLRALTGYYRELQSVFRARFIDDGRKILYWGYPRGAAEIRVMRADGRPVRTVMKMKSSKESPKIVGPVAFAPDGRRVAFVVHDGSDETHRPDEVFVIDLDGSKRRRITFNETDETALSWGPGGTRLAVVHGSMYDPDAPSLIKIIPIGAGPVVELQRPADGAVHKWAAPVWSPSGDHVAFTVENDAGQVAAYVSATRNGEIARVTEFDHLFGLLSWMP